MITPLLLSLTLGGCTKDADVFDTDKPEITATAKAKKPKSGELTRVVNLPEDQAGLALALAEPDTAQLALEKLVAMGPDAVPALRDTALHGSDMSARGWAIQGLAQIDDESADTALLGIQDYGQAPELVRTWAAAGRVQRTNSADEVLALAPLAAVYPALNRPIRLKLESFSGEIQDIGSAIGAVNANADLTTILAPVIIAKGHEPLMDVMFHHEDTNTRRTAAAYLGSWAGTDRDRAMDIAKGYAYTPGAEETLWQGGALYVPSLAWKKKEAQVLAGHLVSWHLYCDLSGNYTEKNQIFNNLQSINLHQAAGWPGWPSTETNELLVQYGQAAGKQALKKVLAEHGVKDEVKYQKLLDQVK